MCIWTDQHGQLGGVCGLPRVKSNSPDHHRRASHIWVSRINTFTSKCARQGPHAGDDDLLKPGYLAQEG